MFKPFLAIAALGAVALVLPVAAHAADPTCPACKMTLSAKKSAKTPVGVRVGKKVFYCCSGCDMKGWKKDRQGNVIPPPAPAAPKKKG